MAIKTWNTDAEAMRLDKIERLKDAIEKMDPKCGLERCVGYDGKCPVYGERDNCMKALLLDQLELAEKHAEEYKDYEADKALKEKEGRVAEADLMLTQEQAALELELNGAVSVKTKDAIRNVQTLADTKRQAFQAVAKYDVEREAVRKSSITKEVSK